MLLIIYIVGVVIAFICFGAYAKTRNYELDGLEEGILCIGCCGWPVFIILIAIFWFFRGLFLIGTKLPKLFNRG